MRVREAKAQGWAKIPQFQHKAKRHRAQTTDQTTVLSPWSTLEKPRKLDLPRINWKGTLYSQKFDARPKLRKRGERVWLRSSVTR